MTEAENTDVVSEAVAPPAEEMTQVQDVYHEGVPDQTGQSDKEMNFAAMRQKTADLESRLDQASQVIEALQGQVQQQVQPAPVEPEPDQPIQLAPDEWLTYEQYQKLNQQQQKNTDAAVAKALAEERQRRTQEELPGRIKGEYPDFDQVVSKENIEYLKANKPHLAVALAATQDPYAQAKAAYDAVKAFCPSAQVTSDKKRAETNAMRPGSLDQAGPARNYESDPKRITTDTKAQLWKEMQEAARG